MAGGLIAGIKRASKYDDKYSLPSYEGMITKKGNQGFNHQLKRTLYFFVEGITKGKNKNWKKLLDNMKVYYREKHPDWEKGKIASYARKFVETKFLDKLYKEMVKVENVI